MGNSAEISAKQSAAVHPWVHVLAACGAAIALAVVAHVNYLFFHVLSEMFSIVIAFGIFVIAWNTRKVLRNGAVLFLGVASLFIGFMDLIHTLAYSGMHIIRTDGSNEATQLWIAARYLQAGSFLAAPFLLNRRLNAYLLFWGYAALTAALFTMIFEWRVFPVCFVEGDGLTRFKIVSEYVISGMFGVSAALFVHRRETLNRTVLLFLVGSILATIVSELAFTSYISVFGFANVVGHILKVAAFFLLYKAIIEIGLRRPYDLLFRDLKLHDESLQEAHDILEGRVRRRTADLSHANEQLRGEIEERERAQAHLQVTNRLLELLVKTSTRREYLDAVARELAEATGCRCVGIRVKSETGQIPYEAAIGFDEDFLARESNLMLGRDACVCSRVIGGISAPEDAGVMSPFGSLCCPDLASFIQRVPVERRGNYRGHCAVVGFATLVVAPVRYHGEVVGAIHLADERPGMVPPGTLALVESLSPLIGEAAHGFTVEEQLRRLNEELEERVELRTREAADARVAAEERAAELEVVNKELEAFSYTVSHDLRSPLRAIDGFSRILETDYGKKIDTEGVRFVNIIRNSVARMGQLIDDLLAFSRLGRQGIREVPVDMKALVAEVWEEIDPNGRGRNVRLEAGDLPPARGDRAMLRQVLHNLIGNAVKFSANRAEAVVSVSARADTHKIIYCVEDNGIGFDTKYAEKIFGVFQRLHRVEEYEGTGVGLAIVRRIVERHGGQVWVDAEQGRGASFFFTLPGWPARTGDILSANAKTMERTSESMQEV
jgi:signal transduction histidine kinase